MKINGFRACLLAPLSIPPMRKTWSLRNWGTQKRGTGTARPRERWGAGSAIAAERERERERERDQCSAAAARLEKWGVGKRRHRSARELGSASVIARVGENRASALGAGGPVKKFRRIPTGIAPHDSMEYWMCGYSIFEKKKKKKQWRGDTAGILFDNIFSN